MPAAATAITQPDSRLEAILQYYTLSSKTDNCTFYIDDYNDDIFTSDLLRDMFKHL